MDADGESCLSSPNCICKFPQIVLSVAGGEIPWKMEDSQSRVVHLVGRFLEK